MIGNMTNKTFLVTGGTSEIGLETVLQLARTGANVFFSARDEIKAEQVVQDVVEKTKMEGALESAKVGWVKVDNTSLQSVKEGAEEFLRRSGRLNVLVCNAGTLKS